MVAATPIDRVASREDPPQRGRANRARQGRPDARRARRGDQPAEPSQGKWGLALRDLDGRTAQRAGVAPGDGVLVIGVQPGSAAEKGGVRAGDIILEVNHRPATSVAEIQAEAKKQENSGPLLLLLKRGEASLFAALEGK